MTAEHFHDEIISQLTSIHIKEQTYCVTFTTAVVYGYIPGIRSCQCLVLSECHLFLYAVCMITEREGNDSKYKTHETAS